jgi:hypothetical protein
MAWYCEKCQKEVDGREVDVARIMMAGRPSVTQVYHRPCFGNVRAIADAAHPAPPAATREEE